MSNRFALSLSVFILSVIGVNGQLLLAEIQLPQGKITDIQSYVLDDTIFLSVDTSDPKFRIDAKRFYQIGPDRASLEFSTTLIGHSPLCSVSRYDNDYYLYYLSGKRKNLVLKALTYNTIDREQKLAEGEIELQGSLIGTWNNDGLFLIIYDPFSNQLKVLHVNKMQVKNEITFDLPIDLKEYYKTLTYIPESRFTSVDQGSAKFKLYKIKNELLLSVDYSLAEGASSSQTTVVRMNMDNGSQKIAKFPDNALRYFRSFIHNDMLYKASVSKNQFLLRINHLNTGSLIGKKDIKRDTTFKEIFTYRRIGSDFRISQKETLYNMMKISSACLPSIVVSEEDSCHSSLIWGTYFNDKGVGSPAGFATNPIAGLVTMAVGTAIKQMAEAPGVSRYFYLESSCEQLYEFKENTNVPLRQLIDDYEVSLDVKRLFSDYKGYFDYQDGGVGVYRGHRDDRNKLTLIKFNQRTNGASN